MNRAYRQKPMFGHAIWRFRGPAMWRAIGLAESSGALTRASHSVALDLTFDNFRWDKTTFVRQQNENLVRLIRSFTERINSIPSRVVFTGADTEGIRLVLHGLIVSTRLAISSAAWGGVTVTNLAVDGTDITALTTPAGPYANNVELDMTTWLRYAGSYTIELTVDGAITLDLQPLTRLLA
ncbi:hypothetical protein CCP3SC15_2610006 [Gammaproteobacteria bacterium]